MKNEHGAMGKNAIMIILMVLVVVLIYILAIGGRGGRHSSFGVVSPDMSDNDVVSTNVSSDADDVAAEFSDGLGAADAVNEYALDETGAGVASVAVFMRDINGDGATDRITRTRVENGTPHFYDEYKIELNINDEYVDITPPDFRTVEGADCALARIQFSFDPDFEVVKIARPWSDTWTTPTRAVRTTYALVNNKMNASSTRELSTVCDVATLFVQ